MEYNTLGVIFRTLRCRWFGRADIMRWQNASGFDDWGERTRLIARLVPHGTRVIEFGAGGRALEGQLDASCVYLPSDIINRGANTLILDLNVRPLPDLRALQLDVAVLAGVVEYLADFHSFADWLSQQVRMCIVSYECAHTQPGSFDRVRETIRRTGAGWVNTFDEDEFVEVFRSAGFTVKDTRDWHTPSGSERIFVFRRDRAFDG
jgi:hypothetical protein